MKRRTKIVCTLGPAVATKDQLRALIDAGMNVARINCSHGEWKIRHQWVKWLRELKDDVGILVDLQGPKFRIGDVANSAFEIIAGQTLIIGPESGAEVPIQQPEILAAFETGSRLLLGDGDVELLLGKERGKNFEAKVISSGIIKSRQGVTLVGKVFDIGCLTPKDIEDVQEAVKCQADFIALSYVHSAADIRDLRRVVERLDQGVALCAKIETKQAIQNLDEIIRTADLIMVARGDMGLQMDIEDVPLAQKRIIERCGQLGKPVITATQMLDSMIRSPRPTRAETTDVANAVLDGTDALMLSGETASGDYPVECVKTMARIAEKAETMLDRGLIEQRILAAGNPTHTEAVAYAVIELAKIIHPEAILTTTTSGQTTRLVSKFRPKAPILCATWNERTRRQMAVVWGVESLLVPRPETTDDNVSNAINAFLRKNRLTVGDHVIITAGVPAGMPGNTNMIQTQHVK
jgi:pyruvate kinase